MKNTARALCFVLLLAFVLSGCSDRPLLDLKAMERIEEDTDKDISLIISAFDNESCSADISVVNNSGRSIGFGEDFYIQRKSGSRWKSVEFINGESAWNAAMFIAESKGERSWTIHWKSRYGVLEEGQYRIVKPYYSGNSKTEDAYCICGFEVREDGISLQPAQGSGAAAGSSAGIAPDQTMQNMSFRASCHRVIWTDHDKWPACYVFTDSASLSRYYLSQPVNDAEEAKAAISAYDDAWFAEHQLIVVPVDEGSGSVRHEVALVTKGKIVINRKSPEIGTCDMASWRIFIEVDKGFSEDGNIKVEFVSLTR